MNTAEAWLQKPGGKWRHGWYEDNTGVPWISNMATSTNGSWLDVKIRYFDTLANKELDHTPAVFGISIETWGRSFKTKSETVKVDQAFVSNGRRFGLFFLEAHMKLTTTNAYSLETFISNISLFLLLFRWFVSMTAMLISYRKGVSGWQTTGLGCLSSSRTFNILPVMLLPRLKMILTVFCTTGCYFEGQQRALMDAWLVMYPGIVELLFLYYSILNIIGKVTYRRISDALFGPTLLLLWAMHFFRLEIAQKRWFGIDGRITTVLLSADVDAVTLPDFITTDVALRLNGNVLPLLLLKLVALALSFIPLLMGEKMTITSSKYRYFAPCTIETSLALRASNVGGLGRSSVYATLRCVDPRPRVGGAINRIVQLTQRMPSISRIFFGSVVKPTSQVAESRTGSPSCTHVLLSYELNRLGYLVFGGKFLISYDDWYVLSSMAPLRVIERLWNYRISVFDVAKSDDGPYFEVSGHPRMCRLDDPQLRAIPFYDVTVCSFK